MLRHRHRRRRRGRGARSSPRAGCASSCSRRARPPARRGLHRPPARHDAAPLPRRRPDRDARQPADRAAARPRRRRHDDRQLRHLLPHARPRARALARGARPRRRARRRASTASSGAQRRRGPARARRAQRGDDPRAAPSALGWSGGYLHRNARGCSGSGVCAFGCPTGAKQHTGDDVRPARAGTRARARHRRARRRGSLRGAARRAARDRRRRPAARRRRPRRRRRRRRSTRRCLLAAAGSAPAGARAQPLPPPRDRASGRVFDEDVDMAAASRRPTASTSSPPTGSCSRASPARRTSSRCRCRSPGDEHRELMLALPPRRAGGLMICDRSRGRVRAARAAPVIRYDLNRRHAHGPRGHRPARRAELAAGARARARPDAAAPSRRDGGPAPLRGSTVSAAPTSS